MIKIIHLQIILAGLAVASPAVKRETSDAHISSIYSSFPPAVTATLGSGAFSTLGYAGSLGNLYAHDDYEYPLYALGHGIYEPYGGDVSEEIDDDILRWGSYYEPSAFLRGRGNLGYGFRGLSGYPYAADGFYGRLSGYY